MRRLAILFIVLPSLDQVGLNWLLVLDGVRAIKLSAVHSGKISAPAPPFGVSALCRSSLLAGELDQSCDPGRGSIPEHSSRSRIVLSGGKASFKIFNSKVASKRRFLCWLDGSTIG